MPRAPKFWDRGGLLSSLLLPASWIYTAAGRARWRRARPFDCGLPVICVGNLVSGGAGKTPLAIDLLERIAARGLRAFALTRGYGGREMGPILVETERHDWRSVGDEALLLARRAPTVISANRAAGARFAKSLGAEVIVMDDGFQNPALAKSLSLLVIDRTYGFGNGRVLPAGPLREPVRDALARADALVLAGEGNALEEHRLPGDLPRLSGAVETQTGALPAGAARVIAFAGIGRPRKFFDDLRRHGLELASAIAFPDHHPYREAELALILQRAEALDALAVTTEKDLQRIPPELAHRFLAPPAVFRWDEEQEIESLLSKVLPE